MSWLENGAITPTIREEKELWAVCPKCHAHFPRADYPKGLATCPQCGAPSRMGCRDRVADKLFGTLAHLPRRAVREGEEENPLRRHALLDEERHAVDERARLAGSGGRKHEQRTVARRRRRALLGIE